MLVLSPGMSSKLNLELTMYLVVRSNWKRSSPNCSRTSTNSPKCQGMHLMLWIQMKRNRMSSWMGSTTRFGSNFSIPTMRISTRWSRRLSLSKTRSKRWRSIKRGKHHSRDSLREATPGLACLSQGLSSETRVWFTRRCMDNVLHCRCNDWTFRHSIQTSWWRSCNTSCYASPNLTLITVNSGLLMHDATG
jgi:hypothetical protein